MTRIPGKKGGWIEPPVKGEVRNKKGPTPGVRHLKTIAKEYSHAMSEGKNPFTGKLESVDPITRLYLQLNYIALNGKNDMAKIAAIREILDRIEGRVKQVDEVQTVNVDKQINIYIDGSKLNLTK